MNGVLNGNGGPGNDGAAGVENGTVDCASDGLPERYAAGEKCIPATDTIAMMRLNFIWSLRIKSQRAT